MCVELSPDEAERQFRVLAFPFLLGMGRVRRWKTSWFALGVRYDPTLRYVLGSRDMRLLLAAVRRRRPQVVVFNERLRADQMAAVAAAAGGARTVYCSIEDDQVHALADFVRREIPEFGAPPCAGWMDVAIPFYERVVLNDAPWAARPLLRVAVGERCTYRKRVSGSPFYRGLGLPASSMSCSFCHRAPWPKDRLVDPVAFAVRQIAAACRQLPPSRVERRFELIGAVLWRRLEEFVRAAAREGIRNAEFSFMPRFDGILGARKAILRCLPVLADSGLAMRLYGPGVENFSPDENARLNKGVDAGQVHEAAAFLARTRAQWPGQFRFKDGQIGMILFTPWTTLEDLRVNIENIERCPLISPAAALRSRLHLFPEDPVTLLAERDGLLSGARKESVYNSGCITKTDQVEIPWKFAHPEVELLCRLGLKLALQGGSRDPLPVFRRALETLMRSAP